MKYQAIVFDLDGTLINSIPDIKSIVNNTIKEVAISPRSDEQILAAVGYGVEHLLRGVGVPESSITELSAVVEMGYSTIKVSNSVLYTGIREMLFAVKNMGIKMLILSNKPHKGLIKSMADHLSFIDFDAFQGAELGKPAKPQPDVLLKMLADFGISPESTLMIGDGEPDFLVAKAAGVEILSVLWGYRSKEALEAIGASKFVESPKDILNYLSSNLEQ